MDRRGEGHEKTEADTGLLKLNLYISQTANVHADANREKWTHIPMSLFPLCQTIFINLLNKWWYWAQLEVVNLIFVDLVGYLGSPEPFFCQSSKFCSYSYMYLFSKENMHSFLQLSNGFGTAKRETISNLQNLEGPF